MKTIAVTGGSGFIGSNFIRFVFEEAGFTGRVVNLDKLTYAANPATLRNIEAVYGGRRYFFFRLDIRRRREVEAVLRDFSVDAVVHLAAETHVDRSIHRPDTFARTNIMGTLSVLEAAEARRAAGQPVRFHNVSTDEVFGSLEPGRVSREDDPARPSSPYAASKAAADHLTAAFFRTYGLAVTTSFSSNNYGPFQYPEKLLPLMILRIAAGEPLPVYGDGGNERDWLHVSDHCRALWLILTRGVPGRAYNVGAGNVLTNLAVISRLASALARVTGEAAQTYERLVRLVPDRPGHDRRYALDGGRLRRELGWRPTTDFDAGLAETVRWYLGNRAWVAEATRRGGYRRWLKKHYGAAA